MSDSTFTAAELRRYARHLRLPQFGAEGQRRLREGSVLVIGAGGLGSPALLYLAAAGAGRIGIVDLDTVDESNLQRQIVHDTAAIGRSKVQSAADRMAAINPHVTVEPHEAAFTSANAADLVSRYDVVLDGSDNFATRYLSSDVCFWQRKPNVYGSIDRWEGQVSVFAPHLGGPCYRCLFPEPPPPGAVPSCAEAGVIAVLPGIVGSLQALEVIKLLTGSGEPALGRLIHFDALALRFREIRLRRDPACPVCGEHPQITAPVDYERFCGLNRTPEESGLDLDPAAFIRLLEERGAAVLVLDVREPWETTLAPLIFPGKARVSAIPSGQVASRADEWRAEEIIVCVCPEGRRSQDVAGQLRAAGLPQVRHLKGGTDALL